MITKPRDLIELSVFGLCTWIGNKIDLPSKKIRMFFIYVTFLALGSPIIIYLILTFVLNLRYMVKTKRNPVWDI